MLKLHADVKNKGAGTRDEQRLAQVHLLHQLGRNRERKDQETQEL
jgi:hypothetical protein